tara:strand:- start:8951 stop:9628 length:678 start_codon:yes stop_codon:yes gene_type:complete
MSEDDTNEENPLRKLIGDENFFAMPEADRLWMSNTVSRVEHEAIMEVISSVDTGGEEEDEDARGAEFDLEGNLVGGTPMPKSVRKILRKILGETEEQDRDHGHIAASAAYTLSSAQFAGSRTATSYVLDQMEEDGDLRQREAVAAYVMFDEMQAVRYLEQSVYNHAASLAAATPLGMTNVTRDEFEEIVKDQQRKVFKRLLASAHKAVVTSFRSRFEALSDEDIL